MRLYALFTFHLAVLAALSYGACLLTGWLALAG
jgi:hypothetical protein